MSKTVSRYDARGREWPLQVLDNGNSTYDEVKLSVLQDIRDELREIRQIFQCPNFQAVPGLLRVLCRNTQKKPKLRNVKKRQAA